MATSLRDVLAQLITETRSTAPSRQAAEDAGSALGHLGRGLDRLARKGFSTDNPGGPQHAAEELAYACAKVGVAWHGLTSGRLTDLAGAAADTIAVVLPETTPTERWAVVIRVAGASRHLATLATGRRPYQPMPEFERVLDAAKIVRRVAAADPNAAAHGHGVLDRPFPNLDMPTGADRLTAADEAGQNLADQLRRHVGRDGPGLSLYQAALVTRSCEAAAAHAITVSRADGAAAWQQAALAWRAVRQSLRPFRDGIRADARPGGSFELVRWAAELPRALRAGLGDPAAARHVQLDAEVHAQLRVVTNQLPCIADYLDKAVQRWGVTGQLCAYADDLPFYRDRAREWFSGAPITVVPRDLAETSQLIRGAGMLSAALAAHLDSGAVGARPQPHLTARYGRTLANPGAVAELQTNADLAIARLTERRHQHRAQAPRR